MRNHDISYYEKLIKERQRGMAGNNEVIMTDKCFAGHKFIKINNNYVFDLSASKLYKVKVNRNGIVKDFNAVGSVAVIDRKISMKMQENVPEDIVNRVKNIILSAVQKEEEMKREFRTTT